MQIPHEALRLPAPEFRMYAVLVALTLGGRESVRTRDVRAVACETFECSPRWVNRLLQRLEDAGWVVHTTRHVSIREPTVPTSSTPGNGEFPKPGTESSRNREPSVPTRRDPYTHIPDRRSRPRAHAHEDKPPADSAVVKKTIADAKKQLTGAMGRVILSPASADGPPAEHTKGDPQ